ncbi:MAG: tripartite tricarboxylate transporter TctB family protein [Alphaproteobacteria bacterium]
MRDRILGLLLLFVCGAVYWATGDLPPPSYEPLGPAAFPRILAIAIAVLAVPLIIKPERYNRNLEDDGVTPTPWMAVWLVLAAVAFAAALHTRIVPFYIIATVFLVVSMAILTRFDRRGWLPTLLASPFIGFGLHYIFTNVFIIDLP